jgi:Tfp pilus assembly protein PilW
MSDFIQSRRPARRRRRLGLSLVEVMISTAISATLLLAAGGAFVASTKAIENNDRFFTASQAARPSAAARPSRSTAITRT